MLRDSSDKTTRYILAYIEASSNTSLQSLFQSLAEKEQVLLTQRDEVDKVQLQRGIELSIKKGIIPANPVSGKIERLVITPDTTVDETVERMMNIFPFYARELKSLKDLVITLQGLSGVGKGTTVTCLKRIFKNLIIWSNGDCFRALTYLVYKECGNMEKSAIEEKLLNIEFIQKLCDRLDYVYDDSSNQWDICIDGKIKLNTIRNTELKKSYISTLVPLVASYTQGEVINFVNKIIKNLKKYNYPFILEGRKETLQYINADMKFELVLTNPSILGQRRAAQRVISGVSNAHTIESITENNFTQLMEQELVYLHNN